MGWVDKTLGSTRDLLRQVFGGDREAREAALSPSIEAEKHLPSSMTSVWGREDVGGLLSVSQNLMDRYADYESMDEYPDINCLDGLTLVFTLEYGWTYIKTLAETGKDFHVISYDKARKALVPALARNARLTAAKDHSKQMVRVVLDNGSFINCTSDHLFMRRDGSWVEAGKLQPTDSLMPGNLRMNRLSRTSSKENYWEVHQPEWESPFRAADGKLWMWLHRLVAQEYFKIGYGDIVHHIDGNPLNNSPSNISIETPKTHGEKHGIGGKVRKNTPPGWNENRRILTSEQNKLKSLKTEKKSIKSKGILSDNHKEKISEANTKPITKKQIISAIESTASINEAAKLLGFSKSSIFRRLKKYNINIAEIIRNKLNTEISNHRIVRIEMLEEKPDVYDLEVPGYHNFVANGVIVHNCFAEGSLVYVTDGSMMKPMTVEQLAFDEPSLQILAFDRDKAKIVKVPAISPRLTGVCEPVIKIKLSNKSSLRVTKDHKILHRERGYVNADTLKVGDELVSMYPGFDPKGMSVLIHHTPAYVTVTEAPVPDGSCRVFDVSTSTHNLIVNGVVCHNSTFNYFANDATQPDIDTGKTIWVHCKDDAVKGAAETLLHKRLRLEDEIWSMAYTLSKYGNDYEEILVDPNGAGVVGLNFLPPATVRRIERADGALIGYVQDVTGKFTEDAKNLRAYLAGKGQVPDHVAVFEDWQVCHMRLRSSHRRSPYGFSVADGARWIWKRLVLLEDAVMIYKLTRSPARFAFYIDVTDIPSDKVELFLKQAKDRLKKKQLVNPRTGRLDTRYNPISMDEDFILAVRDGKQLAKVDLLAGPTFQSMEDIDYFKRMLHGTLKVPRSYLGQDSAVPNKGLLSNEDVRAARVTLGLQRELRNGISRIIHVDLAARKMDPWKVPFTVNMTVPSGIYELAQREVQNARADFASRMMPFVSMDWIRRHVFKLTDEEIAVIDKEAKRDQEKQIEMQLKSQKGMIDLQMQAQQAGQQQLPGMGGPAGEPPDTPSPMMHPGMVDLPRTSLDWKTYDANKRLEEFRERKTKERFAELEEKFDEFMQKDSLFKQKILNRRGFFNDVREAAIVDNNGYLNGVPRGNGTGRHPGN